MTREELKEHCKRQVQQFERVEKIMPVTPNDWKRYEEHKLILELLEQELCEDAVSKEDVLSEIIRFSTEEGSSVECQQLYCDVNNMPPITPIRPKGHWIYDRGNVRCSNCGRSYDAFSRTNAITYNFCPNCRSRNEVEGSRNEVEE